MTYIILILMHTISFGEPQKIYIVTQPTFVNFEQCKIFVSQYKDGLFEQAIEEYNYQIPPKEIYCAEKDAVINMLKPEGKSV